MFLSENKNTGINPHTYRYLNFYNNTKKYTLEKRQHLQNPNGQIVFLHFDIYKLIHIYHPEKKVPNGSRISTEGQLCSIYLKRK